LKCIKYIVKKQEDKIVGHCSYLKEEKFQTFTMTHEAKSIQNYDNLVSLFKRCTYE